MISLGRWFGVQVSIHYSWFIIAGLITFSLGELALRMSTASPLEAWGLAAATAILFFVFLVIHELSHAAVARAHGLPVRGIVLFALGGMAQAGGETPDARTEFLIGIVGPLVSAILGLACLAGARAMGPLHPLPRPLPQLLLSWLGAINLALAAFNLIPGYPLDGGRVLRSAIWAWTGSRERATLAASRVGELVAMLFMAWGIFQFFVGASFGGLWLAIIGFFIFEAAAGSHQQVEFRRLLEGVRVSDLMSRDLPVVDGHEDVEDFVEHELLKTGRRCFVVSEQGRLLGLMTAQEVKSVPRERWADTPLDRAMVPLAKIHAVDPSTSAWEAFEIMAREDLNQLPVVHDHTVDGLVSRGDLLKALQTRREVAGSA